MEELDAKSKDLLIQQAAQCLSKLVQIAPRAKRNFILDQVTPGGLPAAPGGSQASPDVPSHLCCPSPPGSGQCNVYNSGQRRKLLAFKGFCRKVVVVVPTEDDWKKRLELRKEAEGEDVPESVMLEMKGGLQNGAWGPANGMWRPRNGMWRPRNGMWRPRNGAERPKGGA